MSTLRGAPSVGGMSHRFIPSDGLIPSTIFDKGDTDMDISEEMEEIRELLYELIKKNFPRGVASDHLAKKYHEEFVSKGLGRELPSNWLDQVAAAEEFETQARGPLTILFVRLHNQPSLRRPLLAVPPVVVPLPKVVAPMAVVCTADAASRSPLQFAEMLSANIADSASWAEPKNVTVVAYTNTEDLYIRMNDAEPLFSLMKKEMKSLYENTPAVQTHEVCVNGAYCLRDSRGDWFRVIVQSPPSSGFVQCFFVDVGVTGSFPVSSLRFLQLTTVQAASSLATRVSIENLPETSPFMDHALRSILFTEGDDGELQPVPIQVVSMSPGKSSKGARGVHMRSQSGRDVRDLLIEHLQATKENRENGSSGASLSISSSSTGSDFDSPLEIIPMASGDMPNQAFLAHAIYASGPGELSLRQASLDPMPDYMYERLSSECEESGAVLTSAPRAGSFYAAFVDGQWQRVLCVRASKIDALCFLVYLVDVGAFHYAKPDSLRRLNGNSPFKKMLMFKARLFGVAPLGGGDVWSRESQMAVNKFFEGCQGEPVEVLPCGEWTNWGQLNAPCVPVVDAAIRWNGRDLADWLVINGFAVPTI